jgi:competence ComEA-like helix-hairpin-helix protein
MLAMLLNAFVVSPVDAQTTSPSKSSAPATATAKPTASPPASAGSQEQGGLIDINSASTEELDKLPGVGAARAKAIVAHRPYNGKDDLAHRKVIPQNVYDQIKDRIIARQGPTQAPSGAGRGSHAATKTR